MRKIFIAVAASMLITLGCAVQFNQVPARSLAQALKENNDKLSYPARVQTERTEERQRAQEEAGDEEGEGDEGEEEEEDNEGWGQNQDIDFDQQDNDFESDEHKNAQGFLGALETAVNVGDDVKVAGKLAET